MAEFERSHIGYASFPGYKGEIAISDNGMLAYVVRILLGPAREIEGVTVGLVHDHVVL